MTLSNHNPSRLADYFVVCGLDFTSGLEPDLLLVDVQCPPLERSYKGKVLEHYPNNVPWNKFDHNAVCMLCLPHGLQFRTQKQSTEPMFHSFVITREDGSRYYGFSLIFFEEMRNRKVCSAMQTLQAMYVTELSSTTNLGNKQLSNSRSLPRHFKLSTQQSHNYYDATKDTLYVTKSIAVIMQLPYVTAACKFLTALHKYAMTKPKVPDQLSVESYIYSFLYEVPLPQPGRSVQFELVNTEETVILQRPISIEELPLLDFSLRELFSLLSVNTVIQLFTCILLENQVLICSSDFEKLMLVAECLTSLLFPFTWQHVYVPILPASLHHFLDAPVPFIMGLHSEEPQLQTAIAGDLCHLDIDGGKIQVPEELQIFPKDSEFCNELSELLEKYGVCKAVTNPKPAEDVMTSSTIVSGGFGDQVRRKHSWCTESDNNESNVLRRVVEITRRAGVEVDLVNGLSNKWSTCSTENEYKINNAIRETFLNRFVNIFHSYEHFVIYPNEKDKNDWFRNRETMQNFDKQPFLSDQPMQHREFLSKFLESQMFASFIDSKILASFGEIDPNLRVFDKRIKNSRKRNNREDPAVRNDKQDTSEAAIRASLLLIEKRLSSVDFKVPAAKEVLPAPSEHFKLLKTPRSFPALDAVALNKEPARRSRCNNGNGQWCQHRRHRNDGSPHSSLPRDISRTNYNNKLNKNSSSNLDQSPARIAQANWNFVEKLLKDCKLKTNRMVVEKMGAEGVHLGKEQIGNVEENTLIASLCDLLERVWSHAIQQKQGKSALWSHLLRYQEQEECNDNAKTPDPTYMTPALTWCALRKRLDYLSTLASELDISNRSGDVSPATTPDSRSLDRRSIDRRHEVVPTLKPLTVSITFDIRNVQAMSEIKSEIGYSRAWVRLALEKKLLSRHLRTLLSDTNLLRSQYKRNAFLRCDDEKEQFLYHLLSLNAVDYFCFTNTYLNTKLPYRVVVFPSRKSNVSTTTANAWVAVSGTNCETGQVPIPKGTLDFLFHHKNLGMLTSLRIGHDNTGLSPNWMVENVLVRCEVTGHTFRFPCGRYLGKSVDDGSTERLLVGELIKIAEPEAGESAVNTSTPSVQTRSPMMTRRDTRLSVAEIQHMIGDSVNNIVKYFYRNPISKQRGNSAGLTPLLCGEMGLVHSLEQAFLLGFKASRLFGRNHYLWDFFLRVKDQFDTLIYESQGSRYALREGGSLDRRLHDNNNMTVGSGNENEKNPRSVERFDFDARLKDRIEGHIPRSIGGRTLSCDRRLQNQKLTLPRDRCASNERRSSSPGSYTQIMNRYCELVSKIENSSRAFGKDGKFQRFICLAVKDRLLHQVLTPMASSRPTLEMYEDNSFLRNSNLRSFLYEILYSLKDYEFHLESSIVSGIDIPALFANDSSC